MHAHSPTRIPAPVLEALEPRLLLSVSMTPDGWTLVEPSADSRIVYVSSSAGSDSNNGLSESAPVKSLSRAISLMRPGMPDHMLLRRGDVWTGQTFGYWNRQGGRSADEPMLISYYGDESLPRPLVLTGGETAIKADGRNAPGAADHRRIDYFAMIGIHLTPHTYDGSKTDSWGEHPNGIRWMAGTNWALFEDNFFEGYGGNISLTPGYGHKGYNMTVRRNVIVDAWARDTDPLAGRSQGLYTSNVDGLLVEENFFDHNGWKAIENGGDYYTSPDLFSHNMYIQYGNWNVTVRDNIVARASSHGLQLRPGGVVDGNAFIQNAIAGFLSDGDGDGSDNLAIDNVVLHGAMWGLRGDGFAKGWGLSMNSLAGSEAIRNVIAHGVACSRGLTGLAGVTTVDNVVYRWGKENSGPGNYPDASRSIYSYDIVNGGPGTIEHYLAQGRKQSRQSWDERYTAQALVEYIQRGFGVGDWAGPPVSDTLGPRVSDVFVGPSPYQPEGYPGYLRLTFTEDLAAAPQADDLEILNAAGQKVPGTAGLTYKPASREAFWNVVSLNLKPGHYTARIRAASITDAAGNLLNDGQDFTYALYVPFAGDANLDGTVDDRDLSVLLGNWGLTSAARGDGDLNADGRVDDRDLSEVLADWGLGAATVLAAPAQTLAAEVDVLAAPPQLVEESDAVLATAPQADEPLELRALPPSGSPRQVRLAARPQAPLDPAAPALQARRARHAEPTVDLLALPALTSPLRR